MIGVAIHGNDDVDVTTFLSHNLCDTLYPHLHHGGIDMSRRFVPYLHWCPRVSYTRLALCPGSSPRGLRGSNTCGRCCCRLGCELTTPMSVHLRTPVRLKQNFRGAVMIKRLKMPRRLSTGDSMDVSSMFKTITRLSANLQQSSSACSMLSSSLVGLRCTFMCAARTTGSPENEMSKIVYARKNRYEDLHYIPTSALSLNSLTCIYAIIS